MSARSSFRIGVVLATVAAASMIASPSAYAAPTVTVTATPGTFTVGDKISVTASVGSGVDTPASFTLRLFNSGDCSGTPLAVGAPASVSSGGGGPYTFGLQNSNAGTYTFQGILKQETGADIVRCSSAVTVQEHTPNLAVSGTSAEPGDPVRATATLSGRVKTPQNPPAVSMAFRLYGPADTNCTGTPVFVSSKQVYTDNHSYNSDTFAPAAEGKYRWEITYSGDGNNAGVTSNCGVAYSVITSGGPPSPPSKTPTCAGVPATIVGTAKNETILGTNGRDVIVARGGRDVVNGRGGNDLICGGGGDDILRGGAGDDVIYGGDGNDDVQGGPGNDVLYGGRGSDRIVGGPGNDTLYGGPGNDGLDGGKGIDAGDGGPGTDVARSVERRA